MSKERFILGLFIILCFALPASAQSREDACMTYCRDGLLYAGYYSRETQLCEYKRTLCPAGCARDQFSCAIETREAERAPETRIIPELPTAPRTLPPGTIKPRQPRGSRTPTKPSACLSDSDCANYGKDKCAGQHYCDKPTGKCVLNEKTKVVCPIAKDNQCRKNTCNPKTGGCEMKIFAEKPCQAGHPCEDAACDSHGNCIGTWNYDKVVDGKKCACKTHEDCNPQEDGDLCNGVLYCDYKTNSCLLNPSTIKKCPTADDGPCGKNACNPKTGKCEMKPLNEGKTCGGSLCFDYTCKKGACVSFWNKNCQCQKDADCSDYEDGNECNGKLYCDKAKSKCVLNPATIVTCPTGLDTDCIKTSCNTKTGKCEKKPVQDNAPCTKAHPCMNAFCSKGACMQQALFGKPVKEHKCQCLKDSDCAPYEDGIDCNGKLYCDKATTTCKINPATVKKCQ